MIAAAVHGQRLPGSRFVDVTCSRRKQLVGRRRRKMLPGTPSRRLSAALRNRSSVSNANATAVDGGGATDAMGCADDAQLGTPPTPQFEPEISCLLSTNCKSGAPGDSLVPGTIQYP